MRKDQKEAVAKIKAKKFSWHKESSLIGQIRKMPEEELAEYMRKVLG